MQVSDSFKKKNSFFEFFSKIPIETIIDIIKYFIYNDFNASEAYKFLKGNKSYDISEILVRKVYNKIREIIYNYYFIEYETEEFSDENRNKYIQSTNPCSVMI